VSSKIVDANYPEINTVDGICKLNPETLASSIVGSEERPLIRCY
jgi:hypothetical protein